MFYKFVVFWLLDDNLFFFNLVLIGDLIIEIIVYVESLNGIDYWSVLCFCDIYNCDWSYYYVIVRVFIGVIRKVVGYYGFYWYRLKF